ncbi:5-oxoprolinase/urea amidolyase family protein [Arthrobacter sp. ISL-30]|uniref:5-oxoprolinase subunit B/C family protein n=1 Tax=Arthrobacter sp. ISL-30 TaxID=2819109 RepID=UPI001BE73F9B|nr:5-oxoprolinase/urea amidolyase family protein [Arthrobacter sp. ISL-30]MBT2514904.1 5-oxoprolinase/urea amidolyase family protein [Arthrobacter sp. ISL-30]
MSITGIRWAGPRALLVELTDLGSVLALHARLLAEPLPGQLDAVAAAATVLLKFASAADTRGARNAVGHLDLTETSRDGGREVIIEVVYDGEDLAEVGRLTGLGTDGVVAAHCGQTWTAAFGGFAPGFTYLAGEDRRLDVPRRSSPRTAVPAGSVALGGEFAAVYPRQSPGGWQLIGHTTAAMWDLSRESPALVRPGDRVKYVAVRDSIELSANVMSQSAAPSVAPAEVSAPETQSDGAELQGGHLLVDTPGLQSLIQDLGRPGLGDLGVSASGAADQRSARQANRLVGNGSTAAVVENVLGGLVLRARGDQVLAVTGALVPLTITTSTSARRPSLCAPFALLDGETLTLGAPTAGLRSYVAVRGGVDVPPILGSRSSDSMSGIGPAPLKTGMLLPVGPVPTYQLVGSPETSTLQLGKDAARLRVTLGPRDDWFHGHALETLSGQDWLVTEQSNRIGLRLAPVSPAGEKEGGRVLERRRDGELPSEGAVAGSLQVPPNGEPVLFLADHPVTGGYPVIAVVVPEDLPVAAQLPPDQRVRFTVVDPETLAPIATPFSHTSFTAPLNPAAVAVGPVHVPEGSYT